MSNTVADGVAHKVPIDLKKILLSTPKTTAAWNSITPLARNEWICWIEDAKKPETRALRLKRTGEELAEGKRRPCCWVGCMHRTDGKRKIWQKR